ncbi:MAG: hypothetical protein CL811_06590 [Colwelliaceae bacterium]|jgi:ribosomal protein L37AE/L43A|nr:hypothetical protein [Colwelliaceae bacterium]|tara:strand:- start:4696 stop:4914 length:219 start_codon:yes stop_codon:yes gene_type:complete
MAKQRVPKTKAKNERGQLIRRCPQCKSTRVSATQTPGMRCKKCGFVNIRRTGTKEEVGAVSFVTKTTFGGKK